MQTANLAHQGQFSPAMVRRNRMKLLGIFAVALVPVALAFVMYFGGWAIPSDKTNKGNLIWPPVDITHLKTLSAEGRLPLAQQLPQSGKWMLLITGVGPCNEQCAELMHLTRQVNVAMGKEADRVGRMLISTNNPGDVARHDDPAAPVFFYQASEADLKAFAQQAANLGAKPEPGWQVWLVDPLGNVPIQYGLNHTGYDMIGDLKRLLKLSQIG